ncbi:MAG: hypothetical protein PQJ58_07810, partial [Spirochaetales bacterium]|nr:hypothetical protein [Spirochaetales bacterium]
LLYRLILKFSLSRENHFTAMICVVWMSLDVQFLYISRLGRQEILLILILLGILNILAQEDLSSRKKGSFAGLLTGLSAGFHPNSFILACMAGLIILAGIAGKKREWKEAILYVLTTAAAASLFVMLSFHFNPDFIRDYRSYGAPLGVLDTPDIKLLKFPAFFSKLYQQVSGTYHTPNIRMQMILFPLFLLLSLIPFKTDSRSFRMTAWYTIPGWAGYCTGLLIIGKYSQPSISFLLPFYFLSASDFLNRLKDHRTLRYALYILFLGTALFFSASDMHQETERFDEYLIKLHRYIPENGRLLSGLHMDFLVPEGQLYDWRNLHFLKEEDISLAQYVDERDIRYILYTEELSYIYRNRPYWNVLYGNTAHWVPQLEQFTEQNCTLLAELESPGYGIRITSLRYTRPWYVKIYQVDN